MKSLAPVGIPEPRPGSFSFPSRSGGAHLVSDHHTQMPKPLGCPGHALSLRHLEPVPKFPFPTASHPCASPVTIPTAVLGKGGHRHPQLPPSPGVWLFVLSRVIL